MYFQALEKAKTAADRVESDIKAIEQKILEVGGTRMRVQRSKVEGRKLDPF